MKSNCSMNNLSSMGVMISLMRVMMTAVMVVIIIKDGSAVVIAASVDGGRGTQPQTVV